MGDGAVMDFETLNDSLVDWCEARDRAGATDDQLVAVLTNLACVIAVDTGCSKERFLKIVEQAMVATEHAVSMPDYDSDDYDDDEKVQ